MLTEHWRAALPAVLLLVVAATQLWLVRTFQLTPWKGGGFAMFAAVDGGAVRSVRVVVERDSGSEELSVPLSLEADARRAAALPVTRLLHRLARRMALREVRRGRDVQRLTVEAWSATLSADGSQAESRHLATYVYAVRAETVR